MRMLPDLKLRTGPHCVIKEKEGRPDLIDRRGILIRLQPFLSSQVAITQVRHALAASQAFSVSL